MWHDEPDVRRFLEEVAESVEVPGPVLEIGSYAMHDHNPRPLLPDREYVGVDQRSGPGVDLTMDSRAVLEIQEHQDRFNTFALAWSISALEHDPFWPETVMAMMNAVRPGGVVAITVPMDPWAPHEVETSPVQGYYRNLHRQPVLSAMRLVTRFSLNRSMKVEIDRVIRRRAAPHWPRLCLSVRILES